MKQHSSLFSCRHMQLFFCFMLLAALLGCAPYSKENTAPLASPTAAWEPENTPTLSETLLGTAYATIHPDMPEYSFDLYGFPEHTEGPVLSRLLVRDQASNSIIQEIFLLNPSESVAYLPVNLSDTRLTLEDMNFDAYLDMRLPINPNVAQTTYICWTYSRASRRFERAPSLENIVEPAFYPNSQTILSLLQENDSAYSVAYYTYQNKFPFLSKRTQYRMDAERLKISATEHRFHPENQYQEYAYPYETERKIKTFTKGVPSTAYSVFSNPHMDPVGLAYYDPDYAAAFSDIQNIPVDNGEEPQFMLWARLPLEQVSLTLPDPEAEPLFTDMCWREGVLLVIQSPENWSGQLEIAYLSPIEGAVCASIEVNLSENALTFSHLPEPEN